MKKIVLALSITVPIIGIIVTAINYIINGQDRALAMEKEKVNDLREEIKIKDNRIKQLKKNEEKIIYDEWVNEPGTSIKNPKYIKQIEEHIKVVDELITTASNLKELDFTKQHSNVKLYFQWQKKGTGEIELLDYLLQISNSGEFKKATALPESDYPLTKRRIEDGTETLKKVRDLLHLKKLQL